MKAGRKQGLNTIMSLFLFYSNCEHHILLRMVRHKWSESQMIKTNHFKPTFTLFLGGGERFGGRKTVIITLTGYGELKALVWSPPLSEKNIHIISAAQCSPACS